MNNKHNVKLYNVIFPIWAIIFFPPIIIITIIMNFIIDGTIIFLIYKFNKIKIEIKKVFIYIILAFLVGFLIDFIFAMLLSLLCNIIDTNINMYNPFHDFKSLFVYLFVIFFAGLSIFMFNYLYTLKKLKIEKNICLKFGLFMGIITAPWLYLIPNFWN